MAEDYNIIPGAFKALAIVALTIVAVVVVVPLALGLMFFGLSLVEALLKH
jgi:hypothetical protein